MHPNPLKRWHRAVKHHIQTLLIRAGKILFDRAPAPAPALSAETLQSVLFLRQDGKIGDYIVSSFAFRELKKSNPNIRIGVVCTRQNQDLFQHNPYIDRIHTVKAKSLTDYFRVGRRLAGQYQVLANPTVFVRNRDLVLMRALAAPYNIGYLQPDYRIFNLNINEPGLHTAETYRRVLELCGLTHIDTQYDIPEPADPSGVEAFLAANRLNRYIAANFFGAAGSRRFSPDKIRDFLAYFRQHYPQNPVVLLTYPAVTPLLQSLAEGFAGVYVYAGTETVLDSALLVKHAEWVVSPDTSIVHIASGYDKNIIGFYPDNTDNTAYWHPTGRGRRHVLFFRHHIDEITPRQLPPLDTAQQAQAVENK